MQEGDRHHHPFRPLVSHSSQHSALINILSNMLLKEFYIPSEHVRNKMTLLEGINVTNSKGCQLYVLSNYITNPKDPVFKNSSIYFGCFIGDPKKIISFHGQHLLKLRHEKHKKLPLSWADSTGGQMNC